MVLQQPVCGAAAGNTQSTLGRVSIASLACRSFLIQADILCRCRCTAAYRACACRPGCGPQRERRANVCTRPLTRLSPFLPSPQGKEYRLKSLTYLSFIADQVPRPCRDMPLPYLFCSCALRHADGESTVDLAPPTNDGPVLSALVGSLVSNAHKVTDLNGDPCTLFVFQDMSVRGVGTYTLEFRLGEA